MTSELPPEMSLLLEKVTEQLNIQTKTISETITASVLLKVEEKINPIIEENIKLKSEVENLKKRIETFEMHEKRNNVLIHGVAETVDEKTEDLSKLVISTLSEIDVQLNEGEINRIQRLGKKEHEADKIRPILLATTTLQKKIQILKNKKKMKPGSYITQDLPKDIYLKNKQKNNKEKKDNEKRKRSDTPSPQNPNGNTKNEPKMQKLDAFQYLRGRTLSLSEKTTAKN
uniref:Uncharacterized protein n=1 Tax=Heliothis virescens TaxID=7102 RepID=A0A2A4JFH2_HELVI